MRQVPASNSCCYEALSVHKLERRFMNIHRVGECFIKFFDLRDVDDERVWFENITSNVPKDQAHKAHQKHNTCLHDARQKLIEEWQRTKKNCEPFPALFVCLRSRSRHPICSCFNVAACPLTGNKLRVCRGEYCFRVTQKKKSL